MKDELEHFMVFKRFSNKPQIYKKNVCYHPNNIIIYYFISNDNIARVCQIVGRQEGR